MVHTRRRDLIKDEYLGLDVIDDNSCLQKFLDGRLRKYIADLNSNWIFFRERGRKTQFPIVISLISLFSFHVIFFLSSIIDSWMSFNVDLCVIFSVREREREILFSNPGNITRVSKRIFSHLYFVSSCHVVLAFVKKKVDVLWEVVSILFVVLRLPSKKKCRYLILNDHPED